MHKHGLAVKNSRALRHRGGSKRDTASTEQSSERERNLGLICNNTANGCRAGKQQTRCIIRVRRTLHQGAEKDEAQNGHSTHRHADYGGRKDQGKAKKEYEKPRQTNLVKRGDNISAA